MFKVMSEPCDQCLFTKNKIVSDARRKQILRECVETDTHFICHKATMQSASAQTCCASFHEKMPHVGQLHRIAQRLGAIQRVENVLFSQLTSEKP